MEKWMRDLSLTMSLEELGVKENEIEGIAKATLILNGGYKVLTFDEVVEILKSAL